VEEPTPSVRDCAYGPHERNVLDLWQAEAETPAPLLVFIHGGGFRNGDKSNRNLILLNGCLEAGISFAAVNYRLSQMAPYPAQMHDCARAVQFIRHNADGWNIDPTRIAATGGSAGGGISLWLGFHEDLADPEADDPVARQSTRLTCAAVFSAQCTYDPREIKTIIPGDAYKNPALVHLFGLPEGWDWDRDQVSAEADALIKDASPINHLSAGDAPVFAHNAVEQDVAGNIHHANFARHLKRAMDSLGIECITTMDSDYAEPSDVYGDVIAFLRRQFKMP